MNNIIKFTVILLIVTFHYGCNNSIDQNIHTCSIDVNNLSSYNDFFSEYYSVALETTANSMVGNIDKMKICDEKILVLDKNRYKLTIFEKDGRFIKQLDKFGKGHGEYLSIDDFELKDSIIYTLSRASKCINLYSLKDDTFRKIKLNDWYNKFKVIDDRFLWLYSENSNDQKYNFILYDCIDNKYLDKYDKFESNESYGFDLSPFQFVDNGLTYITKPFDYMIYKLSSDSYAPYLKFDFNTEYKIPFDIKEYSKLSDLCKNKSVVKQISNYTVINDVTFIAYKIFISEQGNRLHLTKIDSNGNIKTFKFGEIDDESSIFLGEPQYFHDGYAISQYPAFIILDIEKSRSLSHFKNAGLNENDNPILFFYKLKI